MAADSLNPTGRPPQQRARVRGLPGVAKPDVAPPAPLPAGAAQAATPTDAYQPERVVPPHSGVAAEGAILVKQRAGESRFESALALAEALGTLESWQLRGDDYLMLGDVANARRVLATAIADAFPVLSVQRQLARHPDVDHTAVRIALQGTKILNDTAGQAAVDAEFTPTIQLLFAQAVAELGPPPSRGSASREDSVRFATQDHKGALLVCSCDEPTAARWQADLDRLILPQLITLVDGFLERAARRNPESADKIRATKADLLKNPHALMHLGVHQIPRGATPRQIIQSIAGAESSAKLVRDDPGFQSPANKRGVFTSEKMAGALERFQESADALSLGDEAPSIVLNGIARPVMLSTEFEDRQPGQPLSIFNVRLLRELRKNGLKPTGPDDPNGELLKHLRRALELCGLVDFVYYGTLHDIDHNLDDQLKALTPLLDGLEAGTPIDLHRLRELLLESASRETVCQAGKPSALPFYQRLCSRKDHGILAFDLKGLGVKIQNWQFDALHSLMASGEPVTQEKLFEAMARVNDLVQQEKAEFVASVNLALKATYRRAFGAVMSRGPTFEELAALEHANSANGKLPADSVLMGGDEVTVLIPPVIVEDPDLLLILESELKGLTSGKDARCVFTTLRAVDDSREAMASALATAERQIDLGNQQIKGVESAWLETMDVARTVRNRPDRNPNLPQPFLYNAGRNQLVGYSPDLLALLPRYTASYGSSDVVNEPRVKKKRS